MFGIDTRYKRDLTRMKKMLKKAPPEVRKAVKQEWNALCLAFRELMQNRHLEGGTTVDRLARRSSLLYSSLRHEVKVTTKSVEASVWFLDDVKSYAPTHEKGDSARNIPARMNMRNEWDKFLPHFKKGGEEGIARGLKK
jgi:hypothetical protein